MASTTALDLLTSRVASSRLAIRLCDQAGGDARPRAGSCARQKSDAACSSLSVFWKSTAILAGEASLPGRTATGGSSPPSPINRAMQRSPRRARGPARAPSPPPTPEAVDGQHDAADHLPARRAERRRLHPGQLAWDGQEQVATERGDDRDHHHGQDQPGVEERRVPSSAGAPKIGRKPSSQCSHGSRWRSRNGAEHDHAPEPEDYARDRREHLHQRSDHVARTERGATIAQVERDRDRRAASPAARAMSDAHSRAEEHRRRRRGSQKFGRPGCVREEAQAEAARSPGARRRSPGRRSRRMHERRSAVPASTHSARSSPWTPARSTSAVRLCRAAVTLKRMRCSSGHGPAAYDKSPPAALRESTS